MIARRGRQEAQSDDTVCLHLLRFASNAPFNENKVLGRMLARKEEEVTGVLMFSRRQNSMKSSRADRRVRM